jgi:beta-glucosidase
MHFFIKENFMRLTASVGMAIAFYLCTAIQAQITGRVIDRVGIPIAGATATLKIKNKTAQSDATGAFTVITTGIISQSGAINKSALSFNGHSFIITNEMPKQLTIEIFDMAGKRVNAAFSQFFGEGTFSLPISSLLSRQCADGLYLARISNGTDLHIVPFCPALNILQSAGAAAKIESPQMLAKRLATSDSLIVSKQGYNTVSKSIANIDQAQNVGDITLKSSADDAIEKKVDSLLALMSDDDKIAQTSEVLLEIVPSADVKTKMYGSVFNGGGSPISPNEPSAWATKLDEYHTAASQSKLGIPILYGIDAVHGLGTIKGATVFPHNIGMGCTGDTALVAKMANVTAKEMRAVGINLNFAPAISVVRDERWGRTYEGYGETPEINSMMAQAYVRGLQGYGNLSSPEAVAACAKHFIGDGGTDGGTNGGTTTLTKESMSAIHLPPYQAAVKAGVAAIMPSYNAWSRDGQTYRCTNDKYSLTDLLKTGLTWDGFCLSDWDAIPIALASSNSSTYYEENNVSAAINAGLDMAMIARVYGGPGVDATGYITQYATAFQKCVKTSNSIQKTRLDDAVKRILRVKFRMNLWQTAKSNATLRAEFGSDAHRAIARECVRKSLVLLKNENSTLPLKTTDKVVVVGPWASKLGAQCGGWTISWQGDVDNTDIVGTTIYKGLKDAGGANVTLDEQGSSLSSADKIVLVIGEAAYSEGTGDNGQTNPTPPASFSCPQCDTYKNKKMSINLAECPNSALIDKCVAANKPLIIVLISGRPMIITDQLASSKAFVAAWLPGSEGGGVADVLYGGSYNFTGKLTHTWPKTIDQIPINSGAVYADEKHGSGGAALFENGFGLKY